MTPLTPTSVAILMLLPLIGWRVYVRFKRMVGRQRVSRIRPWITLVLFPLLIAFLASAAIATGHPPWWLALGVVAGLLLAVYGLSLTHFEVTPKGLFHTPNARLGIILLTLFIGRLVFRLVELYMLGPKIEQAQPNFASSPLTLAIFGLLAGYYIGYAAGLIRWRLRVLRKRREANEGDES
jgi:FtsH-binding integral membrane protein